MTNDESVSIGVRIVAPFSFDKTYIGGLRESSGYGEYTAFSLDRKVSDNIFLAFDVGKVEKFDYTIYGDWVHIEDGIFFDVGYFFRLTKGLEVSGMLRSNWLNDGTEFMMIFGINIGLLETAYFFSQLW